MIIYIGCLLLFGISIYAGIYAIIVAKEIDKLLCNNCYYHGSVGNGSPCHRCKQCSEWKSKVKL